HVADSGHRSGAQLRPFHHPGVQLDLAVGVETGADPRVEERFVLELSNRRGHSGQRAVSDALPARLQSALDCPLTLVALVFGNRTRAAVDDECGEGQHRAPARTRLSGDPRRAMSPAMTTTQ